MLVRAGVNTTFGANDVCQRIMIYLDVSVDSSVEDTDRRPS
jgi:hypothetical protein